MLDEQTGPLDFAAEVGFRVVQTGEYSYQYQKVNARGATVSVTPTQPHAYALWCKLVETARQLGEALQGGKEGEGLEPNKSTSVA
jgi:hypothetical protein